MQTHRTGMSSTGVCFASFNAGSYLDGRVLETESSIYLIFIFRFIFVYVDREAGAARLFVFFRYERMKVSRHKRLDLSTEPEVPAFQEFITTLNVFADWNGQRSTLRCRKEISGSNRIRFLQQEVLQCQQYL